MAFHQREFAGVAAKAQNASGRNRLEGANQAGVLRGEEIRIGELLDLVGETHEVGGHVGTGGLSRNDEIGLDLRLALRTKARSGKRQGGSSKKAASAEWCHRDSMEKRARTISVFILHRLHGQEGEVVDEADFFLHEGLAVADAGEQAVVARLSEGALANFFFGNKEAAAGGLVGVLRAVGHEGQMALLDEGRDVDDEAGAHVGVEAGVDDLEGAMRFSAGVDLLQAGEEAGFGSRAWR